MNQWIIFFSGLGLLALIPALLYWPLSTPQSRIDRYFFAATLPLLALGGGLWLLKWWLTERFDPNRPGVRPDPSWPAGWLLDSQGSRSLNTTSNGVVLLDEDSLDELPASPKNAERNKTP